MRKNYIVPQMEVMQLSAKLMQDNMAITHHSGGGGTGSSSGFDESQII